MKRLLTAWLVAAGFLVVTQAVRADDKDDVIDKAIKALGGKEKLEKAKGVTWSAKGTISFGGNDNDFNTDVTAEGIDRYYGTFTGNFGGNEINGVSVLNRDKGWRKFGDMTMPLEDDQLANEKRTVYLRLVPVLITPLKSDKFKVEAVEDVKEGDAQLKMLKVTGPDGKDFKLYFDKESGLPTKLVATVPGFMGEEFEQVVTYKDFKDFGGVMKATKVESTRDGEPFLRETISEFKLLDSVDAKKFQEPAE